MRNIKENIIVSNSFINQKNSNWQKLIDNKHKLNFLEMNEFNGVFKLIKNNSTVNLICFFQEMTGDQYSSKISNLSNFLKNLKNICNMTNGEVILTVSFWRKFSNINFSRNNSNNIINRSQIIKKIRKIQLKFKNLYLIDIDNFFAEKGYENCFSNRDYYLYSSKISNFGLNILIEKINEIYLKNLANPLKVLIFDCDNTLWGGVLGEDEISNIKIGQDGAGKVFSNFQQTILKLSKQGYLVCVASKNNYNDVIKVFKNHKMMVLRKKDVVLFKVNWNQKYKNLIEISKELNLGLNSFLFWDDNKIEREQMKKFLPEVNTIEVDDDITEWPDQLINNINVAKFHNLKEDTKKLKQYKIVGKFLQSKEKIDNFKDEINFLKSIKLKPKLLEIEDSYIARASQMTLKTTQFNFRTQKYSETYLEKIKDNKNFSINLISLKDVYGNHGIVSLFILKRINNDYVFLDTMLMSCRVLGRYLDYWIFNECRKIAKKRKFKFIISEFITTKRNKVFESSLTNNGFKKIKNDFIKKNKLDIKSINRLYFSKTDPYKSKYNQIYTNL